MPDGDQLLWSLDSDVANMEIDPATGELLWLTDASQIGNTEVTIRVIDPFGGLATQSFVISVSDSNHPPEITSDPPQSGRSGEAYTYNVEATDPDEDTLVYALDNPPTGMSIDPDTGVISWTPSSEGSHSVTVTATDPSGWYAYQTYDLTIYAPASNLPPQINSNPEQTGMVGTAYSYQVIAFDPDEDELDYSLEGTPPIGMSIDPDTGLLTWTPAAGQTGVHSVQVIVSDGTDSDDQTFEISVRDNAAPVLTAIPDGTLTAGQLYEFDVSATDADGDALTYSLLGAPSNMTIDAGTGRIRWQTTLDDINLHSDITVAVTDPFGLYDTHMFDLDVVPPAADGGGDGNSGDGGGPSINSYPYITSTPSYTAVVDNLYLYQATATDPDHDPLVWLLDSSVRNMQIDRDTGLVSWSPDEDQIGDVEVKVRARDPFGASSQQTFLISIVGTNRMPLFTTDPITSGRVGDDYSYAANAIDPDGDPLTYALLDEPTGMTIDPNTGVISWTPGATGTSEVIVTATDPSGLAAEQTYQLVITAAATYGRPEITSTPDWIALVGSEYTYQVTATDPDDDTLEYSLGGTPPSGMSIDPDTGLLTWTPNGGQIGTHSLEVIASDGSLGDVQSFDLLVRDNAEPTIAPIPDLTRAAGEKYRFTVYGSDTDGDALTYKLSGEPAGMTINEFTGYIEWLTTIDDIGTYTDITVTVTDPYGLSAAETFDLEIIAPPTSGGGSNQNGGPHITSTAGGLAIVGEQYTYQATATDPDGDILLWSLETDVANMEINPTTGELLWTPDASQIGTVSATILVSDPHGAWSLQEIHVAVVDNNLPPQFTSTPPASGHSDEDYTYNVTATDPEEETLTFSLSDGPSGMTINPNTGVLTWTPTGEGTFDVIVTVADPAGYAVHQDYDLTIFAPAANLPPQITSTAVLTGMVGTAYSYQVTATDPEDDTLEFSLGGTPPIGMSIDPDTGLLSWTPTSGQTGLNTFEVIVSDGNDTDTQYLGISIRDNTAPTITTIPDATVTAGNGYQYDVLAADADGDALTYSISGEPTGMTIDADTGRIEWQTAIGNIGTHTNITVTVTDEFGLYNTDTFDVTVAADDTPPVVDVTYSHDPARLGMPLSIYIQAVDDVGVDEITLDINGVDVPVDANGNAVYDVVSLDPLVVTVTATDTVDNETVVVDNLSVIDPGDVTAPVVAITSITGGEELTEPTDILGTIDDLDDNLVYWTLIATAIDSGREFTLATGGNEITTPALLGNFDTTAIANGLYRLTLTAVDAGGNTATDNKLVTVEGNLKLGAFSISFLDMQIPAPGFPITITRSYSTLDAGEQGDFGYGWSLDIANTSVNVEHADAGLSGYGQYASFKNGDRVVITLPDGTTEGFTFYAQPSGGIGSATTYYKPRFVADTGVDSELFVNDVNLISDGDEWIDYTTGLSYNPALEEFGNAYVLRLRNGVELTINASTGELASIHDRYGNALYFTGDGIESSNGRGVEFTRDYAGRITKITDPLGSYLTYEYDDDGNLIAVTDRIEATARFTYLDGSNDPEHYLDEMLDPYNRSQVRNTYDESGRLASMFDAAGNEIVFTWNGNSRIQTVTGPNGTHTVETDARGNVVRQVDTKGVVKLFTYDELDNLMSETVVVGQVDSPSNGETDDLKSTYVYNMHGDIIETEDKRGHHTYHVFNEYGAEIILIDIYGNTVSRSYDEFGSISTFEQFGTTYSVDYNIHGLVESASNTDRPEEEVFQFTYYESGFQKGLRSSTTTSTGEVAYFEYDENGNERFSWTFVFDASSNQVQVITQTDFDAEGKVIRTRDIETTNFVTSGLALYDFDSDPSATIQNVVETQYNLLGQIESTIDSYGRRTEFVYDVRGNLIQSRSESVKIEGDGTETRYWNVSRTLYDTQNRPTVSTHSYALLQDPQNPEDPLATNAPVDGIRRTYNSFGEVVKVEALKWIVIEIQDDPTKTHNLPVSPFLTASLSSTAANPTVIGETSDVFDAYGQFARRTNELQLATFFTRNRFGDLIEVRKDSGTTDLSGDTIWVFQRTVYDQYGRREWETSSFSSTSVNPSQTAVSAVHTSYDKEGRIRETTNLDNVIVNLVNGESVVVDGGTVVSRTQYLRNESGAVIQTRTWSTEEDGSGDPIDVWIVTRTIFDDHGRTSIVTDPYRVSAGASELGTNIAVSGTRQVYDSQSRVSGAERLEGIVIDISQTGTASPEAHLSSSDPAPTIVAATSTTYDERYRVAVEVDNFGRETHYRYDPNDQVIEVRYDSGIEENGSTVWVITRTAYDAYGKATVVTDAFTSTDPYANGVEVYATRLTYDENDRQTMSERMKDAVIDIDSNGNVLIVDIGTVVETAQVSYNDKGQVVQRIAPDNQTTTFEYDTYGRQTATVGHAVLAESVGIDTLDGTPAAGTLVSLRSETIYDDSGRVEKKRTNIYQYVDANEVVQTDTTEMREEVYKYDEFGNVVKHTFSDDGAFRTAIYSESGQLISETSLLPSSGQTHTNVDGSVGPTGQTKSYEYDARGRLTAVVLPAIPKFDDAGNPLLDGNDVQIVESPRYEYKYDAFGNQTQIKDPKGRITKFTYNNAGQLLTRTLPLGIDSFIPLTGSSTIPSSPSEVSAYTEYFEYDGLGRQAKHLSFEGVLTVTSYNPDTGLTETTKVYSEPFNVATADETTTNSYDAFGRLIEVVHQVTGGTSETRTFTYNERGQLTAVTSVQGTIEYEYDNYGRRTRMFVSVRPDASDSNSTGAIEDTLYTYDALGRLDTVTVVERNDVVLSGNGEITDYDYTLLGELARTDYSNGVISTYDYDSGGHLDVITHYRPDATPNDLSDNDKLALFDYDYLADGTRSSAVEKFWLDDANPSGTLNTNTYSWEYDAIGRLTAESFTSDLPDLKDYHTEFVRDSAGNQILKSTDLAADAASNVDGVWDEVINYTYDNNDRLLAESTDTNNDGIADQDTAYTYDNTQQASKTVYNGATQGTSARLSTVSYSYNLQGRLSTAISTTFDGSGNASKVVLTNYSYDTSGLRVSTVSETTEDTDSQSSTPLVTTSHTESEFLFDLVNFTGYEQTVVETQWDLDANGTRTSVNQMKVFTLGHDIIAEAQLDGTTGGSGSLYTFLNDAHGSTRLLSDSAGDTVTSDGHQQVFHYTAYGEFTPTVSGVDETKAITSHLYSGEYFDTALQQQYLRRRYYDATVGRFNRLDEFAGDVRNPRSLNKYAYTSGDPIRFADPTGMFDGLVGLLLSAGIGTIVDGQDASAKTPIQVTIKYSLKVYEWSSFAIDAFVTFQEVRFLDIDEAARRLLDLNFEWREELLEQMSAVGLSDIKDYVLGGGGEALGRRYVTLSMSGGEDEDQGDDNEGRRRRMRTRSRNRIALALKGMYEFARAATGVLTKINKVTEIIGEIGTRMVAASLGFDDWNLRWKRPQNGPDYFGKNMSLGVWGMFEAKGGSSKLSKGAEYGSQMNWRWIDHWFREIGKDLPGEQNRWAKTQIRNAYKNEEPLLAMVVSLDFHRASRSRRPSDQFRNDDELRIGFQAWTRNRERWEPWEKFNKRKGIREHLGF